MIVCVYFVGAFAGVVCSGSPGMHCCCCCCWLLRAFASLFDRGGAISIDFWCFSAACICCASSGCLKCSVSVSSVVVANALSASVCIGCFSG